jgi:iron-sulfur cluster repair protein YtfE (RIC family)
MSLLPSPSPSFQTVTAYLSWDHDRLDALLLDVIRDVEGGRFAQARQTYREFDEGLLRHIRIEEDVLFPVFEARTGMTGGPTTVMRQEHRDIQRAIALMREGLLAEDQTRFTDGLVLLRQVLPDHNAKEEHVLYPSTDRMLNERERLALAERLQRE